jgi:hypothetical protein
LDLHGISNCQINFAENQNFDSTTNLPGQKTGKESFFNKTLNCAKLREKVQTSPLKTGFCLPRYPSQAGSKPGDSLWGTN